MSLYHLCRDNALCEVCTFLIALKQFYCDTYVISTKIVSIATFTLSICCS